MNRLLLIAAVALALPAAVAAKGPSHAVVTGPGLDEPLTVDGSGEYSGLYETRLATSRPAGELGPQYEIVWTFPFPGEPDVLIRQDLYPFATPAPVTYTPAGQRLWSVDLADGWYVSRPAFRELLVAGGLPAEPPDSGRPLWPWTAAALAVALAAWFARARWISITRAPSASSASTSSTPTTG